MQALLNKTEIKLDFIDNIVVYSDKIKPQLDNTYLFEDLDFYKIFGNKNPVNIEIGVGNGGFITHYAEKFPNENFLGFEVFKKILKKAVKKVGKSQLSNVRLIHYDAKFFVKRFSDESVKNFYINFPDPWPKKRHHKRRILKTDFIEILRDKLVSGGVIHMVTDHEDYAMEIVENLKPVKGIKSVFDDAYVNELINYYETKYYLKFAVHSGVYFFKYVKL